MKKWTEHPLVVLLGLISSVLAIFAFITGINNIGQFSRSPAESLEMLPGEPQVPPVHTSMPAAPQVFVTPTDAEDWSGILTARRPTLNEIRAEIPVSIWNENVIDLGDIPSPAVKSYSGYVQIGNEYLLPVYWCAVSTDILRQNMENIETVLSVNGEAIPEKYVLTYDYDTNTGWKCTYNSVVLGGWATNVVYKLEAGRTFLSEIFDGQTTYPPGEYVYELNVSVR